MFSSFPVKCAMCYLTIFLIKCRKGRYQVTANLLRKYLSDFLIASYLELVHESGFDDTYIQEVEVMA